MGPTPPPGSAGRGSLSRRLPGPGPRGPRRFPDGPRLPGGPGTRGRRRAPSAGRTARRQSRGARGPFPPTPGPRSRAASGPFRGARSPRPPRCSPAGRPAHGAGSPQAALPAGGTSGTEAGRRRARASLPDAESQVSERGPRGLAGAWAAGGASGVSAPRGGRAASPWGRPCPQTQEIQPRGGAAGALLLGPRQRGRPWDGRATPGRRAAGRARGRGGAAPRAVEAGAPCDVTLFGRRGGTGKAPAEPSWAGLRVGPS